MEAGRCSEIAEHRKGRTHVKKTFTSPQPELDGGGGGGGAPPGMTAALVSLVMVRGRRVAMKWWSMLLLAVAAAMFRGQAGVNFSLATLSSGRDHSVLV